MAKQRQHEHCALGWRLPRCNSARRTPSCPPRHQAHPQPLKTSGGSHLGPWARHALPLPGSGGQTDASSGRR
eukprot:6526815-Prymnesium_polylepis.1